MSTLQRLLLIAAGQDSIDFQSNSTKDSEFGEVVTVRSISDEVGSSYVCFLNSQV